MAHLSPPFEAAQPWQPSSHDAMPQGPPRSFLRHPQTRTALHQVFERRRRLFRRAIVHRCPRHPQSVEPSRTLSSFFPFFTWLHVVFSQNQVEHADKAEHADEHGEELSGSNKTLSAEDSNDVVEVEGELDRDGCEDHPEHVEG